MGDLKRLEIGLSIIFLIFPSIVSGQIKRVKQVSAGGYHTGALTEEGKVICWGDNSYDQCNVPPDLKK